MSLQNLDVCSHKAANNLLANLIYNATGSGITHSKLFKEGTFKDVGTLRHLKNVLHRSNVVHDPKNDYNAFSGIFETIVEDHIVAAVMEEFDIDAVSEKPKHTLLPEDVHSMPEEEQETMLAISGHQRRC